MACPARFTNAPPHYLLLSSPKGLYLPPASGPGSHAFCGSGQPVGLEAVQEVAGREKWAG